MKSFSAHNAKQRLGELLRLTRNEPVAIHKYNRCAAVLISAKEYRAFQALRQRALRAEAAALIAEIETGDGYLSDTLIRKLSAALHPLQS